MPQGKELQEGLMGGAFELIFANRKGNLHKVNKSE